MKRPAAIALTLLVLGAALLALAAGQTWVTATLPPDDLVGLAHASRSVPLTGNQLAGGLSALALAALAAGAALISTKGRGRVAVGVLAALVGAGSVALSVHTLTKAGSLATSTGQVTSVARSGHLAPLPTSATGWPIAAILAGVIIAVAGVIGTRGTAASQGLSSRYEPPAPANPPGPESQADTGDAKPEDEAATWSALDRGEDPTVR